MNKCNKYKHLIVSTHFLDVCPKYCTNWKVLGHYCTIRPPLVPLSNDQDYNLKQFESNLDLYNFQGTKEEEKISF